MQTKYLMLLSACFNGGLGLAASFAPQEILSSLDIIPWAQTVLLLQIMGALYLGFAILNWMARGVLIGGVYSRPLAIANFAHFGIVTMAMSKMFAGNQDPLLLAGAVIYGVFAVWFGIVLFTHPVFNKT